MELCDVFVVIPIIRTRNLLVYVAINFYCVLCYLHYLKLNEINLDCTVWAKTISKGKNKKRLSCLTALCCAHATCKVFKYRVPIAFIADLKKNSCDIPERISCIITVFKENWKSSIHCRIGNSCCHKGFCNLILSLPSKWTALPVLCMVEA